MEAWQQRVIDEQSEVAAVCQQTAERLAKLEEFIKAGSHQWHCLSDDQQMDLIVQANCMEAAVLALVKYKQVLEIRIFGFVEPE